VSNISVAVMDKRDVPDEYHHVFDYIIEIPWKDDAENSDWKIENKWKYIYMSPYDETVVLDTDMIFTSCIDEWWELLANNDVFFTTSPQTFRGNVIESTYYRKAFESNKLPNVYTAFMYFKKTPAAYELFDMTKIIFHNWQKFYFEFLDENRPTHVSGDVCYALATKLLGKENEYCNNVVPGFVHMKTFAQDVDTTGMTEDWTMHIPTYYNSHGNLKIGNFSQYLPFHYYVKNWLTDDIIARLKGIVS
jgi:hypothetical protein